MKSPSPNASKPVWVLTGPTASGKSDLALALAERTGAEIVIADSVQVVRGFDLGSAKPSKADQNRIPHHLLDVVAWNEPLDACQWAHRANEAIADIHGRDRPAILVGGTGLYLKALREGLIDVRSDADLRKTWLRRESEEPGSLYRALQQVDPESALRLSPRNPAHLLRALEISLLTGEPASVARRRQRQSVSPWPQWTEWVLVLDDEVLRERMKHRVASMLDAGWIAETAKLLRQGVCVDCQAMRAIGYREIASKLGPTGEQACKPEDVMADILKSTWQYARRQRTWLRREERQRPIHRIGGSPSPMATILATVLRHL